MPLKNIKAIVSRRMWSWIRVQEFNHRLPEMTAGGKRQEIKSRLRLIRIRRRTDSLRGRLGFTPTTQPTKNNFGTRSFRRFHAAAIFNHCPHRVVKSSRNDLLVGWSGYRSTAHHQIKYLHARNFGKRNFAGEELNGENTSGLNAAHNSSGGNQTHLDDNSSEGKHVRFRGPLSLVNRVSYE